MAGFSDQVMGLGDLQVVPHPSVMAVIDIGGGLLVEDVNSRDSR